MFDSFIQHQTCYHRLSVRTLGFHPKKRSSILRGSSRANNGTGRIIHSTVVSDDGCYRNFQINVYSATTLKVRLLNRQRKEHKVTVGRILAYSSEVEQTTVNRSVCGSIPHLPASITEVWSSGLWQWFAKPSVAKAAHRFESCYFCQFNLRKVLSGCTRGLGP